ncbi:MAG: hypothetical protein ACOZQL_11590 [Myxococcota bacterium]
MNESRPSVMVSVFSALMMLGAVPLGLTLFAVLTGGDLAGAWNEGGWTMSVMLVVAGLASLTSAVGAFLLSRGTPWVTSVGAFLTLVMMAVAVFGFRRVLLVTTMCGPDDAALVRTGELGEASRTLLLGASLAAAWFLSSALSMFIAAVGARALRRPLLLLGAGALSVAVWQTFVATAVEAEASLHAIVADAAVPDFEVLFFSRLEDLAHAQRNVTVAVGAVVFVAVLACALLRATPRVLIGVVAGVLVPVVGFAGLRAFGRQAAREVENEVMSRRSLDKPLFVVDGTALDRRHGRGSFLRVGTSLHGGAEELDVRNAVELALEPEVTPEALLSALRRLRDARATSVTLLGTTELQPPPGLVVPPYLRSFQVLVRGVRVAFADLEQCGLGSCAWARLEGDKLVIDGWAVPLVSRSRAPDGEVSRERFVHLRGEGLSVRQLLDAALTAREQGRLLALHLE